ncbi:unnamed protein product [Amoebophrya sp. A120]|nr:unnamed protein product [Amoebophrya sp. A120]|eukprot:GSA120T00024711001.1
MLPSDRTMTMSHAYRFEKCSEWRFASRSHFHSKNNSWFVSISCFLLLLSTAVPTLLEVVLLTGQNCLFSPRGPFFVTASRVDHRWKNANAAEARWPDHVNRANPFCLPAHLRTESKQQSGSGSSTRAATSSSTTAATSSRTQGATAAEQRAQHAGKQDRGSSSTTSSSAGASRGATTSSPSLSWLEQLYFHLNCNGGKRTSNSFFSSSIYDTTPGASSTGRRKIKPTRRKYATRRGRRAHDVVWHAYNKRSRSAYSFEHGGAETSESDEDNVRKNRDEFSAPATRTCSRAQEGKDSTTDAVPFLHGSRNEETKKKEPLLLPGVKNIRSNCNHSTISYNSRAGDHVTSGSGAASGRPNFGRFIGAPAEVTREQPRIYLAPPTAGQYSWTSSGAVSSGVNVQNVLYNQQPVVVQQPQGGGSRVVLLQASQVGQLLPHQVVVAESNPNLVVHPASTSSSQYNMQPVALRPTSSGGPPPVGQGLQQQIAAFPPPSAVATHAAPEPQLPPYDMATGEISNNFDASSTVPVVPPYDMGTGVINTNASPPPPQGYYVHLQQYGGSSAPKNSAGSPGVPHRSPGGRSLGAAAAVVAAPSSSSWGNYDSPQPPIRVIPLLSSTASTSSSSSTNQNLSLSPNAPGMLAAASTSSPQQQHQSAGTTTPPSLLSNSHSNSLFTSTELSTLSPAVRPQTQRILTKDYFTENFGIIPPPEHPAWDVKYDPSPSPYHNSAKERFKKREPAYCMPK